MLRSRRRCCICFGLNRDTSLKSGQIAHLDKNNQNNHEDNLAFLCLDHHDEYDSRSSQRKNLTQNEVKEFRDELSESLNKAFTQSVHFGELRTPPSDPFAGQYIRLDSGSDSADISFTPLPDSIEGQVRYFVAGYALWGAERERGPNMGTLEFVGEVDEKGRMVYRRGDPADPTITFIQFLPEGHLVIDEENWIGEYGMNVNFEGAYRRLMP